jgi:hypothetical protein
MNPPPNNTNSKTMCGMQELTKNTMTNYDKRTGKNNRDRPSKPVSRFLQRAPEDRHHSKSEHVAHKPQS